MYLIRRKKPCRAQSLFGSAVVTAPPRSVWRLHRALRYMLLRVAPFSLLLVFVACGAPPLPVTHRPAADLRLEIHITGQYSPYSERKADAIVQVHVYDGTNQHEVALADKAHLTCNGTEITSRSPATIAASGFCPRQAPGGSYQITYTDEHGASTTAIVPIPLGSFSILSPLAGSTVPIPTNGVLTVRVSLPTPPPNGSVAVDRISVLCGAYPNFCGGLTAELQNDVTLTTYTDANAASNARNVGDKGLAPLSNNLTFSATPTPPATPTPGQSPLPAATPTPAATSTQGPIPPPPTATMTQDGTTRTITLRGDYSQFAPKSGEVGIWVKAQVAPDPGGFAAATAIFGGEYISSAITWAR
jgi:hypothetical protein